MVCWLNQTVSFSNRTSMRVCPSSIRQDRDSLLSGQVFVACDGILSADEKSELDHYMLLEHLMRLAKARARRYVSNA